MLLLSSGELSPRQRLRNQTPDFIGLELKRRLLQSIAALDPEPGELEAILARLIDELGSASGRGPVRALALGFRDEWQALPANPAWIELLQTEAARRDEEGNVRC
jgi:hypothetical protein